ncbi:hypothetical protein DLJ53_19940 [Acuticoccus sediminis]|uniref:Uncharacterized protein n=1 Tax=Acuticoccus sediminis TaxID=2184697 RepID=A0A8B2NK51_9HYPH|nr:hypothetical protein [Acuticoccus sediminis]RAI00005.1 hypothetical protein DLJ53_19940 [Acuticoccus sediminis]
MLNPGLRKEIGDAAPAARVTAVVSVAPELFGGIAGEDVLQRMTAAKQPVLEALQSMQGVQVNALPGLPHAIAVAPAAEWQALIERNPWLSESDGVRLDPNEVVATTL